MVPHFTHTVKNQHFTYYHHFAYFIYQTRNWLLLLGFHFANPENGNFQKKLYLD